MKKSLLRPFLLFFIFLSLTGCATAVVRESGTYWSTERPERAVVLRNGRVVIDFIKYRQRAKSVRVYYKRVYFKADDFPQTNPRPGAVNCGLECRITGYLDSAVADDQKGSWVALDSWRRDNRRSKDGFPIIPEQDRDNICIYNGDQGVFHICDEEKQTIFEYSVKTSKKKKREWWGYPVQVLYIPAVIVDFVMYPVYVLIYGKESW